MTGLLFFALSSLASAAPLDALTEHFSHELQAVQSGVEACQAASPDFENDKFYIYLTPSVSFGISSIFQVSVTPEIDFIWEKVSP
jgi:hypothetical protein